MKTLLTILVAMLGFLNSAPMLEAQGTAFTYQGRLLDGSSPANGSYDLRFALYTADSGGTPVGPILTTNAVAVSSGVFTVALDFGANIFTNADRFLEIAVRTNNVGGFTNLSPRQKLTPAPYAIFAENVGSGGLAAGSYANAVTFNNAANSFSGNGTGLTGVNATTLGGLSVNQFWKTGGNAGTTSSLNFVGTTDNQALELRVNGVRALRLQPNTNAPPNLIGGSRSNVIASFSAGATIAGGDKNFIESFNGAASDFAAIGGGSSNQIGYFSFNAVIGGGFQNTLEPNDYYSTLAGGLQNHLGFHAVNSTISGGRSNTIDNSVDTSTIAGGGENAIGFLAHYASISAGRNNLIRSNAEYSAIGGGRENTIQAGAAYSRIGGGERNQISDGLHGTIAGGGANAVHANSGTIGGGTDNAIETNADESAIGGGFANLIHTNANRSTIAGGAFHELLKDAASSFIGGGTRNKGGSNAYHATISGGSNNTIDHDTSYGFIGGGKLHLIGPQSAHATIAGGDGNTASGEAPAIGGGTLNVIEPGTTYSVIAGGGGNHISADSFAATVAGGYLNAVAGNFSLAAGNRAQANHPGSFVWAGGNTMPYASIFPNCFNIYASNGVSMDYSVQTAGQPRGSRYVYIGPFNAGNTISTWNGARLTDGGIWSNASDRNRKTDFTEVDAREVLAKLAALPVRQWRYTNEEAGVKHLGPVAQDFASAFGLGDDDKTIGTVDADGVALAAIQGLNQKLESQIAAQRSELQAKDERIANLERRLDALEKWMRPAAGKGD